MFYETGTRAALSSLGLTKLANIFKISPGGVVQNLVPEAVEKATQAVPKAFGGAIERGVTNVPHYAPPKDLAEALGLMNQVPVRHFPVEPPPPPMVPKFGRPTVSTIADAPPAIAQTNPKKITRDFNQYFNTDDPAVVEREMRALHEALYGKT